LSGFEAGLVATVAQKAVEPICADILDVPIGILVF
jgi:hypothetical protein